MINRGVKIFFLLKDNPWLFFRKLFFEIRRILPFLNTPRYKKINGVLFEFGFPYSSVISKMYFGIYEYQEIKLLKRILQPGDTFIDIGANIGYFSAIAAGLIGKKGSVHSFEPVPQYFQRLQKMASMNPDYKIIVNQCALGETEGIGQIAITNDIDNIGWNTMVPSFMKPEEIKQIINIPVKRLDAYIKENELSNITLVKIDVEGFEFPVLKGLSNFFIESKQRPQILCEINPDVCSLMDYSLKDLFDYMKDFGYSSFDLNNKRIGWSDIKGLSNILFSPQI